MIVLITFEHFNKRTNKKEVLVSHGIDTDTFQTITLPSALIDEIGYFDWNIQEWVLKD